MMNYFEFGPSADIEIVFDGAQNRKLAKLKNKLGKKEKCLLYQDGETVSGKVNVTPIKSGVKLKHYGIKIELIGQMEFDRNRSSRDNFVSLVTELARPDHLIQSTSYPFKFANVEMPFEVFDGKHFRLRYFLRVTIVRRFNDIVREIDIAVHKLCNYPEMNRPIHTVSRIDGGYCMKFDYNKQNYHLNDVIEGNLCVLWNRMETKHVEISIIMKQESQHNSHKWFIETVVMLKLTDSAPVIGENIPIRLSLSDYDLSPTMQVLHKRNFFSTHYFLKVGMVNTNGCGFSFKKNYFGFGQSADIDIVFDGAENRKLAEVKTEDSKKEKYLLYYDGETVSGKVNVTLRKPGSKLEHHGIKIELIGQIELYYDRGNHHEFTSLVRELARPGDLIQNTSYPFEFANVEKPFEVYVGSNVRLRYFLRVTIVRRISDIVREIDIAVHTLCSYPEMNCPIKMEVGIEDCLHIEFEYNKSKYHLKDVIVGKIYFLLVRIKIKHMEIAIIKRETTGSGPNTFTENETIAKYEIMDGAPVKGESIPIRVFLAGYDLTPTMRDINKKFSVRYFLNLVLMDTEDRRYFKQQEITLWRKADKSRKSALTSSNNPHVPSHLVGSDGEMMGKQNASHQPNEDDDGQEGENDPTMGLFTQESPQQPQNPISIADTNSNSPSNQRPAEGTVGDQSASLFDEGTNPATTPNSTPQLTQSVSEPAAVSESSKSKSNSSTVDTSTTPLATANVDSTSE